MIPVPHTAAATKHAVSTLAGPPGTNEAQTSPRRAREAHARGDGATEGPERLRQGPDCRAGPPAARICALQQILIAAQMLAIGAGFALPRTGRTNPDSVCSSSLALSGARIGARARAQAARLCPSPCPARGEDRNSETQGRGRGGRDGGAADAPRGEPGGCRAAACDGSLVCAARGPPRAPHGAAPALSPILASRFSRRAQWRPFPSSRKQQYARIKHTRPPARPLARSHTSTRSRWHRASARGHGGK